MTLKAVVFGLEGVLINSEDGLTSQATKELKDLFALLRSKSILPVVFTNRNWVLTHKKTGEKTPVAKMLVSLFGEHTFVLTTQEGIPPKPQRAAIEGLLDKLGMETNEVIYVGRSMTDFRTAINGGLLFLNAVWTKKEVPYGFECNLPSQIGEFVTLYCLKKHPWYFSIDTPVTVRAMAPFSTLLEAYTQYSQFARQAAKTGTAERHFFTRSLVTSLYFSGLIPRVSYVACVPGHKPGYGNAAMDDVLTVLGQNFHKNYIPDLLVRHAEAPKSQSLRMNGQQPSPLSQLKTIVLTGKPIKKGTERYKNRLSLADKTVLVIDDFCTQGYSLEAARNFIEAAGGQAILVAWLKTINRDYEHVKVKAEFDPYQPQSFANKDITTKSLSYQAHIVDPAAPYELAGAFKKYKLMAGS
jgi:hypothetical protein